MCAFCVLYIGGVHYTFTALELSAGDFPLVFFFFFRQESQPALWMDSPWPWWHLVKHTLSRLARTTNIARSTTVQWIGWCVTWETDDTIWMRWVRLIFFNYIHIFACISNMVHSRPWQFPNSDFEGGWVTSHLYRLWCLLLEGAKSNLRKERSLFWASRLSGISSLNIFVPTLHYPVIHIFGYICVYHTCIYKDMPPKLPVCSPPTYLRVPTICALDLLRVSSFWNTKGTARADVMTLLV